MVLKGRIYLTGNIDHVLSLPQTNQFGQMVRVLNMDEDNVLNANQNPMVIQALCLLPPVEAKIAESDGDEQKYDYIYHQHLLEKFQQEFITVILAFLYKGGDLVIFLPEEGYTNTRDKFIQHLDVAYGISVGIVGEPQYREPMYNLAFVPFWLGLLYLYDIISWQEYMIELPLEVRLDSDMTVVGKLINDMHPYVGDGNWYENIFQDQVQYLLNLHHKIHTNINTIPAIIGV